MDFSRIELDEGDETFLNELRAFLKLHVTDEVRRRDRESGDNFDEKVHLALGAAGYLSARHKAESEGGFTPIRRRIWELEIQRALMPSYHMGTTFMIAKTLEVCASEQLKQEVIPKVLSGDVRLCLGYTEPEGGSDVATCNTRAVRDGADWIINGSKMFTSNAQHSQFVFLITNTDPGGRKHKNLTMFLVPLDLPGIEIHGIRTIDGDRTNIVYYSDVRVADRYRVGDVNGGWGVVRLALDDEHGVVAPDALGLTKLAAFAEPHGLLMAAIADQVTAKLGTPNSEGQRPLDDSIQYRLGRCVAHIEAALSTPGMFGRVAIAQTMRDVSIELMDMLGTEALLPADPCEPDDLGGAEYLLRMALPTGIYGGTLEVFRNMIAQALGLGRPSYSMPRG